MNRANLPKVMLSMAQNRSLAEVLRAIVDGLAECRDVALARIWLEDDGDLCASCRFRPECPDQRRCLHLVASAGNSSDATTKLQRTDGAFRRFPLGVRKIGRVGQSGEPLLLAGVRGTEEWVADPAWARRAGVQAVAVQPLVYREKSLGVLALFDRGALTTEDFEWLRVVADHAAVSIANARAFEEIESLKARLEAENQYLRAEVSSALGVGDVGDLIGASAGLQKVVQQVQLVAPTDAAVLITGESGTGKEVVARAIHENSARKGRAFIKVNCSAVPETLFEAEFFGHAKGAFTGAMKDRPGRFELAEGGTLLLDEIGEVPPAMQGKLLRVLQEREVERVGETRVRKLDVRVLAATNRDLKRECEAGRFRLDLFYRLSVFPIELPPLRARREDLESLATHFVALVAKKLGRHAPALTRSALAQLAAHDWPGNVRELQNAIERAVILSTGGPLRFDLGSLSRALPSKTALSSVSTKDATALVTRDELKRRERASITEALARSGGRLFGPGGAAELLGTKPTTLASRIKALGIARSAEPR